ncbi:fluoride efflux transporter FluC [Actinoalloteichus hymeniacidonis]|uniref:Fluoride-specific ion channel FluC n=1 Tax=Actinoalloteichus hymeniacidonis TaxID=340345 RepID=A0AAC9MWM3_9PSEU|nr:CrcB family protein [Actinoalloteichus hymeniacidonis]AOS61274.1 hypothetical protein TL08_02180 [Actinoalloteichus hymeniacidonis]MBB5910723.1 CrcB protein [Actinoalloteichus hymeniacidonis]
MRDIGPLSGYASVAAGGALGTLARYGIGLAVADAPGGKPLGTLGINIVGCLLIGVLTSVLHDGSHPLLRPFLATGVLGGFTTFSAYALDIDGLVATGRPVLAMLYLIGTLGAALIATVAGRRIGHRIARLRRRTG